MISPDGAPGLDRRPGSTTGATAAAAAARGAAARDEAADPETGVAIATRGLTKRHRSGQVAVDGIDLVVPTGSVYGFLGPNGSGKTTTIRMLLGLVRPTAGTHDLLGEAMPRAAPDVLPRVGALVDGPAFHGFLSGRENLARLDAADLTVTVRSSKRRISDALDRVGLSTAAAKPYHSYSLGMRQRLGLAGALLRPRELYVLDEPTNGLDPQGTREVRTLVREVGADGATVFVSSHLLSEIEQVCTHVGVMSRGRLVYSGPLADMQTATGIEVHVDTPDPEAAAAVLARLGTGVPELNAEGVRAPLNAVPSEAVTAALVAAGVRVRQLVVAQPDLEEVFVSLTGEGFDVDQ